MKSLRLPNRLGASACPLCLGWGQPSKAQQLVATPQAVLALPTADASRFRVIQLIKGERPADGMVEGGYPRSSSPAPGGATPTNARLLLLVRDDPWIRLVRQTDTKGISKREYTTLRPRRPSWTASPR
jgi:hypothetical protein